MNNYSYVPKFLQFTKFHIFMRGPPVAKSNTHKNLVWDPQRPTYVVLYAVKISTRKDLSGWAKMWLLEILISWKLVYIQMTGFKYVLCRLLYYYSCTKWLPLATYVCWPLDIMFSQITLHFNLHMYMQNSSGYKLDQVRQEIFNTHSYTHFSSIESLSVCDEDQIELIYVCECVWTISCLSDPTFSMKSSFFTYIHVHVYQN